MELIKIFYDLETTGVDPKKHSIHQISGIVEVDGFEMEAFDFKVQPHPKAILDPSALLTCRVTEEEIRNYPPREEVYKKLIAMLSFYINRYDRNEKAHLVGYNNRAFDDVFFRAWFKQLKDDYFGSWFWPDSIDVLVLASQHLLRDRAGMDNFQLATVARYLGVEVDLEKTHKADYDVHLTKELYYKIVGY